MIKRFVCAAVDCTNSLGRMQYAAGTPVYRTERYVTTFTCQSGYRWSDNAVGTTARSGTCTDMGAGVGNWVVGYSCVGVPVSWKRLLREGTYSYMCTVCIYKYAWIDHTKIREAECLGTMTKGSNAMISGAVSINTPGSTVNAICNSGYIWAGGQTGSTPKTATCTDTGSGSTWTLTDTCVGALWIILAR